MIEIGAGPPGSAPLWLPWPAHVAWGFLSPCSAAHTIVGLPMPVLACPHHQGAAYDCGWAACIVVGHPTPMLHCPCHRGAAYAHIWPANSVVGLCTTTITCPPRCGRS